MSQYPEYVSVLPESHPVRVYFDENLYLQSVLKNILEANIKKDFENFFNLFNQLSEVEKRYARKENQLFPYLEKHGWNGPSQGMWSFHDQIRDMMRSVRKDIETKQFDNIANSIHEIASEMNRLMQVEEGRLFPNAMELLSEDDWKEMYEGDEEIGWMLETKPSPYPTREYIHPSQDTKKRKLPFSLEGRSHYDEGYMTPDQVNLLLRFLPVDITYVDENDRVIFYNRGEQRVFPRSAGIIGREVRFCHPPKSVDTVLRILEEFKKGTKDEAEFWIRFKGQVIHIRYFAIRDNDKNYKGVIEMSQDITDIQKLEGQQRLLDWD